MSFEETLLIREEDESTLVHRRFLTDSAESRPPPELADVRPCDYRHPRAVWVGLAGSVLLAAFLATCAVLQHRELTVLRQARRELEAESKLRRVAEAVLQETPPIPSDPRIEGEVTRDRALGESDASTLLLTKQYRRALFQYRLLAREYPAQAVYVDFVRVLEAKTGCFADDGSCQ